MNIRVTFTVTLTYSIKTDAKPLAQRSNNKSDFNKIPQMKLQSWKLTRLQYFNSVDTKYRFDWKFLSANSLPSTSLKLELSIFCQWTQINLSKNGEKKIHRRGGENVQRELTTIQRLQSILLTEHNSLENVHLQNWAMPSNVK